MGYFLADLADVVIGLLLDPWLDTWFHKMAVRLHNRRKRGT